MDMRLLLFLVIIMHGLIHLLGFAKAFKFAEISQLTQEISKPAGLLWLFCAFALTAAGVLFFFRQASWWWVALPAVVLSQTLIIASWGDAKFGTAANLILLLPLIAAALEARPGSYGNRYKAGGS